MTRIALLGAGGKMGLRIAGKLKEYSEYSVGHVEIAASGIERLNGIGVQVISQEEALKDADEVILAVPDIAIADVCKEIVDHMKPGSMIVALDPAAAYAGLIPAREDVSIFIAHPCHPSIFSLDPNKEALNDYFGGIASMDIVCALYRGSDSDYANGEKIARVIYSPVRSAHRITVEQMVILEPALVETVALTLVGAMKEAVDAAAEMGVPSEVAKAFLWGHVRTEMASMFGVADFPVSDGAIQAMNEAREVIFKPDWKQNVFNLTNIGETVKRITGVTPK